MDKVFNLFDQQEKMLFLMLLKIVKKLNCDPDKVSIKFEEYFKENKKYALEAFINTLMKFYKDEVPANCVGKLNIALNRFNKKEESKKKIGRLPTKKIQVSRRTKSGNVIQYQTTVYVNPEKLARGEKIKGFKDSFERFFKSSYYKDNKEIFKNYEKQIINAFKNYNYKRVGDLMSKFYHDIGIKTVKDKLTSNMLDKVLNKILKDNILSLDEKSQIIYSMFNDFGASQNNLTKDDKEIVKKLLKENKSIKDIFNIMKKRLKLKYLK